MSHEVMRSLRLITLFMDSSIFVGRSSPILQFVLKLIANFSCLDMRTWSKFSDIQLLFFLVAYSGLYFHMTDVFTRLYKQGVALQHTADRSLSTQVCCVCSVHGYLLPHVEVDNMTSTQFTIAKIQTLDCPLQTTNDWMISK